VGGEDDLSGGSIEDKNGSTKREKVGVSSCSEKARDERKKERDFKTYSGGVERFSWNEMHQVR